MRWLAAVCKGLPTQTKTRLRPEVSNLLFVEDEVLS